MGKDKVGAIPSFLRLKNILFKVYREYKVSRWVRAFAVLLSASIVTFLVARQIFFATLAYGDCPLIELSSGNILKEYMFSVWHRAAYGESYPSPQGYLFLYLFSQIASYFKGIDIFNFLMNLSFPLSFLAFYAFSRRFCEGVWSRLFAATLYIINPVVIAYYNFGGFMWSLVFLPLALLSFIDLLEDPAMRNLAKAAVFISLVMWTFPTLSVTFLAVLFAITVCYLTFAPSKLKFLKGVFPKLLLLGLFMLVCNAPYLLAQFIYLNSPAYGFEQFSILRDFKFTYGELTLFNFIRFAGNTGSPQTPLGYNDPLNLTNEVGLIIPVIAFSSVFFARGSQTKKQRVTALLVVVFLLAAFVLALRIMIYSELSWVVRGTPALWTIRNPIKLQLMLAVCMVPLFAFSTERTVVSLIDFFRKKKPKKAVLTFVLVLLALSHVYVYNFFVFNGCMGLDKTYGSLQNITPDKALSRILEDSSRWCVEQNYRGIILPFDHKTEVHVQFTNPLLYTGRLGLESKVVGAIDNELKSDVNLTNLLRLLSTKYVYVNKAWRDTGFHIVQPQSLENVVEGLEKENLLVEDQSEYSKFVIEPVLPRLYLSQYPVFYSNIETIKFVDSSVFSHNPAFFEIKYDGCQTCNFTSTPTMVRSYSWEMPFSGVFDAYVLVYGEPETTVHFSLDEAGFQDKTISTFPRSLKNIGRFELKEGAHRMLLAANQVDSLSNLKDFHVEGSCSVEGNMVKVENGFLLTANEYDNFDFNVDFKPVKFGEENWQGPNVYFAWADSSYVRLIFHSENYVELAKKTPEGYIEGIIVKQAILTPGNWYNLRIIKDNQTLVLYLNGEHLLSFTSPLLSGKGRVGVGSDNSVTCFENLAISKDIVAGVWLFPAENPRDVSAAFTEMAPEKYSLQFNQTRSSWSVLVLNENYDPYWEATLDGTVLKNHFRANFYANCWFTNVSQGFHKLEIHYKPNTLYQILLYLSIAAVGITLVAVYIPEILLFRARAQNVNKLFKAVLRGVVKLRLEEVERAWGRREGGG